MGFDPALRLFPQRRQGDRIHPFGHREHPGLTRLGNHDDGRLERRTTERLGNGRVPANVAKPHHPRRVDGHTDFPLFHICRWTTKAHVSTLALAALVRATRIIHVQQNPALRLTPSKN